MSNQLVLEVGKAYRTREGEKVILDSCWEGVPGSAHFSGVCRIKQTTHRRAWQDNGRWSFGNLESKWDIVALWDDPGDENPQETTEEETYVVLTDTNINRTVTLPTASSGGSWDAVITDTPAPDRACSHKWKVTQGFLKQYEDCELCGAKREDVIC